MSTKPLRVAIMAGMLMTILTTNSCQTHRAAAPAAPAPEQLLLEWMKVNQDTCSPGKQLVGDIFGGVSGQTFNNALAAMAFMLMDERERAERILDFYARRINPDNEDKLLQNFYLQGEARGFYQNMAIRDLSEAKAHRAIWNGDRWLGDMCWLLMACKQYEKHYASDRYAILVRELRDLMASWYVPQGDDAGYIGSGWRHFDETLHEKDGHAEGNVDAYAVFMMTGDEDLARRVAAWLLPRTRSGDRPLDLFTWKVLAFGKEYEADLARLETLNGYKKTLHFNGKDVVGFTAFKTPDANIWGDGLGHVACAYYAVGNTAKGDYYLGEMEKLMVPITTNGVQVAGIPYAAAKTPGFEWVNPDEGFVSCAAWYIFAKKKFNPMRIEVGPAR
jgi:hypothetical protein